MLATFVICTVLGFAVFGFLSELNGRPWAYLRLLALAVVATTAISAAALFFMHDGWDTSTNANNTHHGKGGVFVFLFNIAVSIGPIPVGFVFLVLGVISLKIAYAQFGRIRTGQFQKL